MGLKRRQFVYVSDRNQEFEIDEMQSSHLMNAIHHHQKQWQVCENLCCSLSKESYLFANVAERQAAIEDTINELQGELASRTLEDDAKRDDGGYTRGNSDHRY